MDCIDFLGKKLSVCFYISPTRTLPEERIWYELKTKMDVMRLVGKLPRNGSLDRFPLVNEVFQVNFNEHFPLDYNGKSRESGKEVEIESFMFHMLLSVKQKEYGFVFPFLRSTSLPNCSISGDSTQRREEWGLSEISEKKCHKQNWTFVSITLFVWLFC